MFCLFRRVYGTCGVVVGLSAISCVRSPHVDFW